MIIFNPTAGRRRTHLLWRVLDTMVASGTRIELSKTARAGDAETLARCAAQSGVRVVVAAGGDGTIAEVANGLMGTDAKLGIIPLGTANVLARELALPFDPDAVAAALAFGRTRTLWPGLVRSVMGSRLFVQMLGVGFDAHVVHRLSLPLKRICGRGAYVWQTMRELPRYGFPQLRLRIDGAEVSAASAIICKGSLYGGAYILAPEARPCEPGFSVVLFARRGPVAALLYGAALPFNALPLAPGISRLRGSQIDISGTATIPAQADGDPAGLAPFTVSDAPAPIRVIVGRG